MKKIFALSSILFFFTLTSCKKENVDPKPLIADIAFSLYDLKTDSTIFDINYQSTLILKGNYTWTLDFNGAVSSGTYSWTSTSQYQALVKFSIQQWTQMSSDTALSTKLKKVIQAIDNCGFPGPNIIQLNFLDKNYTSFLRTNKK